jgi:hypothetical protein
LLRGENPVYFPIMKTGALFLLLVAFAYGDAVTIDLRFARLNLKNGVTLNEARLLSYDPDQGSVTVIVGKSMRQLQVQQLPDEVVKQLEVIKPKRNEGETVKLQQRAAEAELAAQKRATRREEDALADAKVSREAQRQLDVTTREKEERKAAATEAEIAKAAEDYARYYFNYQNDPHSSVGAVLNAAFQMESPEPVAGWSGRWRVKGAVGLTYATNTGGSLGRKTREFEILLEVRDKGKPKIVDLTVK